MAQTLKMWMKFRNKLREFLLNYLGTKAIKSENLNLWEESNVKFQMALQSYLLVH